MRRLLLLFLFAATPLFAQQTDLAVSIENTSDPGTPDQTFIVHTVWHGTTPVTNAVLEIDIPADRIGNVGGPSGLWNCDRAARPVRCISTESLNDFDGYVAVFAFFDRGGTYTSTARLTSAVTDPNPSNNVATLTTTLTGQPGLSTSTFLDSNEKLSFDVGDTVTLRTAVQNHGFTATDVTLTARLPEGGTFTSVEFSFGEGERPQCQLTPAEITCHVSKLAPEQFDVVRIKATVPPTRTNGGTFRIDTFASSAEGGVTEVQRFEVPLRRQIVVTSDADDGSGSLRQALRDAAATCRTEPCTIVLQVPAIQPRTALPDVSGSVRIVGGLEAKTVLDGSLLTSGDAFRYRNGCELIAEHLVVREFPGHAFDVRQPGFDCRPGFSVPVRIAGNELIHNLRGVVSIGMSADVVDNVIRDHRRAGVFVQHMTYARVTGNTITGNGAAGVFIDPAATGDVAPAADITGNVIRDNGEFGVARTEHGVVQIRENEIAGNQWYGIDLNLDLSTPNRAGGHNGVPNKPELIDAIYDPVSNTTRVRGTLDRGIGVLDFYASHSLSRGGYPEAEHLVLGNAYTGGKEEFDIALPGDLRGQWITATATNYVTIIFAKPASTRPTGGGNTSELSDAVKAF